MSKAKKDGLNNPTRSEAYSTPHASAVESEVAPAESLVTPEEVIRHEVGESDVERLREWNKENQL